MDIFKQKFTPGSKAVLAVLVVLCLSFSACGGGFPITPLDVAPTVVNVSYGTAMDQRTMGDMAYDKDLELRLKQELMHLRAIDGFFMNIYAFNGRVFLVGDPPDDFKELAIRFVMHHEDVVSLDYCFFPHNSGNVMSDFITASALRSNLILEPGISSSWVETEVYASCVVLLGVVEEKEDLQQIEKVAWSTSGVSNVVSFLMVEQ